MVRHGTGSQAGTQGAHLKKDPSYHILYARRRRLFSQYGINGFCDKVISRTTDSAAHEIPYINYGLPILHITSSSTVQY